MPEATEIYRFMFQLGHRDDLRRLIQTFEERVMDHLAEPARKGSKLLWRQWLIAEEDDGMFEPQIANMRQFFFVKS